MGGYGVAAVNGIMQACAAMSGAAVAVGTATTEAVMASTPTA